MPSLTKGPTVGDLLKFDLDKNYTHEVVTLASGTAYKQGAVLGQITASGKFTMATATGSTGEESAAAVLLADVDASSADAAGVVIKRGPAILSRAALVFGSTVDNDTKRNAKIADLTALGIVTRTTA
ncbi:MAG TPA: head decoration protein [Novosphingobium sp.]|jgi:hypothetical protein|nr:head decoration protein [Novosphingobium sp.]